MLIVYVYLSRKGKDQAKKGAPSSLVTGKGGAALPVDHSELRRIQELRRQQKERPEAAAGPGRAARSSDEPDEPEGPPRPARGSSAKRASSNKPQEPAGGGSRADDAPRPLPSGEEGGEEEEKAPRQDTATDNELTRQLEDELADTR